MITKNLDLARRGHCFLFITRLKPFSKLLNSLREFTIIINNKIISCWSDRVTKNASARPLVTSSARDHVGVQLQVSNLNFL